MAKLYTDMSHIFSKIMILTSETTNTAVFLSVFTSFVYLLCLRKRTEMEMDLLVNVNKHFNKLQAWQVNNSNVDVLALVRTVVLPVALL